MKNWLERLKITLIEENIENLEKLIDDFNPKNASNDELNQAKALLDEAFVLMQNKKAILALNIQKLQRAKEFLKA